MGEMEEREIGMDDDMAERVDEAVAASMATGVDARHANATAPRHGGVTHATGRAHALHPAIVPASSSEADEMSAGMLEFVESMGRYFEQYGISRIGGRILGLLTIADRPLSLDEIATRLRVSRASVSTNMRVATASDLAQLVTFPGDRRDYYRMIEDAWGHAMRAEIEAIPIMRRIAEQGLAALPPGDSPAREHLEEMIDFCEFAMDERRGLLERWQARRAQRRRAGSAKH